MPITTIPSKIQSQSQIADVLSKLPPILKSIKKFYRTNKFDSLPDISQTVRQQISSFSRQFKDCGISMYYSQNSSSNILGDSPFANAIVQDLLKYLNKGYASLQEKSLPNNELKQRYLTLNNEILSYTLKDNLIPAIANYMNQTLNIHPRHVNKIFKDDVLPTLQKLGFSNQELNNQLQLAFDAAYYGRSDRRLIDFSHLFKEPEVQDGH